MKKVLLITALSLCVSSAFAAETATLKVQGTLTNAACTPSLSNGGVVDFGKLKLGNLSATETNQLGNKEINLTITCDAATKVAWNTVDERHDTNVQLDVEDADATGAMVPQNSSHYGLGKTAGGIPIGVYSIATMVDRVTADSLKVVAIASNDNNVTWGAAVSGSQIATGTRFHSVAATGSLEPLAFTTATFPLKIAAAIQDTTTLAITDDTQLDGLTTISLFYL